MNVSEAVLEKESALRLRLRETGKAVVAFSGGVDSSYLAFVASSELGSDALCVTGISPSVSLEQRDRAGEVAAKHGFSHRFIETEEISDPRYVANPTNRCFYCKTELYGKLSSIASEAAAGSIMDGTNADDLGDHRPGRKAAEEFGVESPLAEIGFTKDEIRELSRAHGLETWDMPASPCLASRIQYGMPVTIERLSKIENGEAFLRNKGFVEFRVRSHGDLVRLEFTRADLPKAYEMSLRGEIAPHFRSLGFRFVTIDSEGFRSGSMNAGLKSHSRNLESEQAG
jgi:uncharacterized protein